MTSKPSLDFVLDSDSRVSLSDQIVAHFELLVLSGRIPQNFRLPSGLRLAKEWGCSYVTVQKAMRQLAAKGLAHRKPQKGTFINVPDVMRIVGVLVGPSLSVPSSSYFRALASGIENKIGKSGEWPPPAPSGAKVPPAKGWGVRVYDDIQSAEDPRHPGVHNLLEDLKRQDFAGFVEIGTDHRKFECLTGVLPKPCSNHSVFDCSSVTFDHHDFTVSAVRYLAGRGMRRMVYFRTSPETPNSYRDCNGMFDACAACSLPVPEIRQLRFGESTGGHQLEELAHDEALNYFRDFNGTPGTGIIVSDDIAARGIALALIRLGLDRPDCVNLITGANEGIDYFYGMPVAKYERSISAIVDHLTSDLWNQIIGKPPAERLVLKGRIRPPARTGEK